MKWHDAKKEWPLKGFFVLFSVDDNEHPGPFGEYNIGIVDQIKKEQIIRDKFSHDLYINRIFVTYWCYIDDIPKPEVNKD